VLLLLSVLPQPLPWVQHQVHLLLLWLLVVVLLPDWLLLLVLLLPADVQHLQAAAGPLEPCWGDRWQEMREGKQNKFVLAARSLSKTECTILLLLLLTASHPD
jgi:hypothetical protein